MTTQKLSMYLRSLLGMLELESNSSIYKDVVAVSDFLETNQFRIAVFAPFNHGKSTLLNALLGNKTLPIDLIPTTGAIIQIRYGEELQTTITFNNGENITETGTKILKTYGTLDGDRIINKKIKQVIVSCNHPLLKNGAELIDLPGTNDREEQDKLVKNTLLTANLVIQVLDARKLMTLAEREQLKSWLQNRGINSVIFVVNFLNLLTPEEQTQVQERIEYIAENLDFKLPKGIKTMYRVDALPALRAKLKGNHLAIKNSGLSAFESALKIIINSQKDIQKKNLSQVKYLAENIFKYAVGKKSEIQQQITLEREKQEKQTLIKQKAAKLIQKGLQQNISELESVLYLPNLLTQEQVALTIALQQERFIEWKQEFINKIAQHQQNIQQWIDKSKEFYAVGDLEPLLLVYPLQPKIQIKDSYTDRQQNTTQNYRLDFQDFKIPSEVSSFIKKVASNYPNTVLENIVSSAKSNDPTTKLQKKSQLYIDGAHKYLSEFSQQAFIALNTYQVKAEQFISYQQINTVDITTTSEHQLKFLESLIDNIHQELE